MQWLTTGKTKLSPKLAHYALSLYTEFIWGNVFQHIVLHDVNKYLYNDSTLLCAISAHFMC